jgi:hypothetical protein
MAVVTPPARLPVTIDEIRVHMRIDLDDTDEVPILMANIQSATDQAERWLRRSLITRTFDLWLDRWPTSRRNVWWDGVRDGSISDLFSAERHVDVPAPPLQSVTSITTFDDSDAGSDFASSKFFVDTATEPGRIVLRDAAETPAPTRVANGIQIRCVAGYGDNYSDVPEPIRQGILRMAAHLYEARGECPLEEARDVSGASALWQPYRILRLA